MMQLLPQRTIGADPRLERLRAELELLHARRLLDDERRGRARELHDHVAQTLFAIELLIHRAVTQAAADGLPPSVALLLAQVGELVSDGSAELREATRALDQLDAEQRDVATALAGLVDDFRRRTGLEADLLVTARQRRLPTRSAEALLAVAREALDNVEDHARARAVLVCLRLRARSATLCIHDDGVGPSSSPPLTCGGLGRAADRVRRLRGTLSAEVAPEGGFQVRVQLPVPRRRRLADSAVGRPAGGAPDRTALPHQ